MTIDEKIIAIAKKYTYHKRSCMLDISDNDEGDYCTCNKEGRINNLAIEIHKLINEKLKIKKEK